MKTIGLDENNNILIKNGSIVIKEDIEACTQDVKTRVGLSQGENPFNLEEGIDWDNVMLGKMGSKNYIKAVIRSRILDSEEITGINNLTLVKDKDILRVVTEVQSIYGVANESF